MAVVPRYYEETVRYEVWEQLTASDGEILRERLALVTGYILKESALSLAAEYTAEEEHLAWYEERPVTKTYFVVKATTSRVRV